MTDNATNTASTKDFGQRFEVYLKDGKLTWWTLLVRFISSGWRRRPEKEDWRSVAGKKAITESVCKEFSPDSVPKNGVCLTEQNGELVVSVAGVKNSHPFDDTWNRITRVVQAEVSLVPAGCYGVRPAVDKDFQG